MRIRAAIRGDLEAMMQEELMAATAGVQRALRRAQSLTKGQLRSQVERAGLGSRSSGRDHGGAAKLPAQWRFHRRRNG